MARRRRDFCRQATRHGAAAWEHVGAMGTGAGMALTRTWSRVHGGPRGRHQHRLSVPRRARPTPCAVGRHLALSAATGTGGYQPPPARAGVTSRGLLLVFVGNGYHSMLACGAREESGLHHTPCH
jgi:hypothetical protein